MLRNDSQHGARHPDHYSIKVNLGSLSFDMAFISDTAISAHSEKHNHYAFEVHYCLSGAGTLHIGSVEETIVPGTTMLIGPGVYHSIRVQPDNPIRRYLIQFTFVEAVSDVNVFQLQESREILDIFSGIEYKLFNDGNMELAFRTIEEIYREMDTRLVGFYSQIQSLFTQLLIRLIRLLSASRSRFAIPEQLNDDMRTRIIDAFFDRYREDLTIDELAAQLHLSTKQTNRILHKYYRTSFKQKQLATRIQVAMDLLRTSRLPIEEIAEQVGYASIYNFCKIFRQKTGQTPTQYREGGS